MFLFTMFAVQNAVLTGLSVAMLVAQVWAILDAAMQRSDAFIAADKLTKQAWLIILGLALFAHLLIWAPFSILNLIGIVAALVYLLDARPAMRSLTRR